MAKKILPLSKVYRLIEPGPVVLLTTSDKGAPNAMPMSWHTMLEFDPPLIGCVVSDRDFSFTALMRSRECVVNIPGPELARQVVQCGNTSGRSVDKFKRFGLTPKKGSLVRAPLIEECFASLECKVIDTRFVKKYAFFVLEVVKAWIDPDKSPKTIHHMGRGKFMISGKTIQLKSKMK